MNALFIRGSVLGSKFVRKRRRISTRIFWQSLRERILTELQTLSNLGDSR